MLYHVMTSFLEHKRRYFEKYKTNKKETSVGLKVVWIPKFLKT